MPLPTARAFVRSTVESDPSKPLFWRYRTVIMRPAYDTSADLPPDVIRAAIDRSMATWNGAADGCSDFRFGDGGQPTGLTTNGFGGERDGENRIVWHENDWPADLTGGDVLAVTTTLYRVSTGQILDADIDVNGAQYTWTDTTDPSMVQTDVQNAMTHELGHVLGLAHSPEMDATMYYESPPGDLDKRTLAQDDVDGLCYIYPERLATPGAPPMQTPPLSSSCSASPGRGGSPAWMAALLACALWWRQRALSKRRRASPRGLRSTSPSPAPRATGAGVRAPPEWA